MTWLPIDQAPKDGTPVMLKGGRDSKRNECLPAVSAFWDKEHELCWVYAFYDSNFGYCEYKNPTHFMLIPEDDSVDEQPELKLQVGKSYEVAEPRYVAAHGHSTIHKIEEMVIDPNTKEKRFRSDDDWWFCEDGYYRSPGDQEVGDFYSLVREVPNRNIPE